MKTLEKKKPNALKALFQMGGFRIPKVKTNP
jgi:hypothetical protein